MQATGALWSMMLQGRRSDLMTLGIFAAPPATLRKLRLQHWGGFVLTVLEQIVESTVGRIWNALKGG